ncbi:hypothetical protein [Enterococcus faecium]|uniref:hypothetical protein n=1 Tax=Enterococcus TaxID=1350 RepID=UPI0019112A77|nr:hypothetical protein [Enterococcus faecium]MBK5028576.1 hypothetical protein [Enterococcus faecium]MBK5039278.1 hypothetical protein [Enterococcus faecium]MBK5044219.1 hypothetical protein [Enterococcus faecium]MBK5069143.1 hypothetical protein [Enterococcus faecium]MBK5132551.1 hypothetical protein [Enterococcus faecium]
MKLFVGLDVSSEKLDACFMTDDSTCSVLKEASYGNSQLGASSPLNPPQNPRSTIQKRLANASHFL